MKIIIAPAKKMTDETALAPETTPELLERTEEILARLRTLSFDECKRLWGCNDELALLNFERLRTMDLHRNLAPALLSYVGIQYQYMAASVMEEQSYAYLQRHLRILSGFYGVLRPFDGVTPYRLEMQARLSVGGCPNLYRFWGSSLHDAVMDDDRTVVDLASKEYSKCVTAHARPGDRIVEVVFGEMQAGRVVQKGTFAKMARGECVRLMAESNVCSPEGIRDLQILDYRFAPELSDESRYVFLKD